MIDDQYDDNHDDDDDYHQHHYNVVVVGNDDDGENRYANNRYATVAEYFERIELLDAALDCPAYNGGTTGLDMLAHGVPMVRSAVYRCTDMRWARAAHRWKALIEAVILSTDTSIPAQ